MTTELEQKIAEQAAVIEKLRDVLGEGVGSLHKFSDGFECRCSQCNFVRLKAEALAIPTDSKKILADWLDSVLGDKGEVMTNMTTVPSDKLAEMQQAMAEQADRIKELESLYINASHGEKENLRELLLANKSCEEQAAVIEKLKKILDMAEAYFEGEDVATIRDKTTLRFGINEALTIPTDSKQILAEWLDKVLGEPELHAYKNTGQYAVINADASDSRVIALFKKPEIK